VLAAQNKEHRLFVPADRLRVAYEPGGTPKNISGFSGMLSPRTLRGRKRRHHRARLALVVAVLGILSVLVVRGIVLLWQGSGIVTANESPLSPLHYRPQSPDVLRSPYPPRSWGI
jgi:hypothetical protein